MCPAAQMLLSNKLPKVQRLDSCSVMLQLPPTFLTTSHLKHLVALNLFLMQTMLLLMGSMV